MVIAIYIFILALTCFFSSLSLYSSGSGLPVIGPQIKTATGQISYTGLGSYISSMTCLLIVLWFAANLTTMSFETF